MRMSEEAPKLYTNKPKKAQLKQFQEQLKDKNLSSPTPSSVKASSAASASAAAESYRMGSQSTNPPPQPPKESFARRYKFIWPLLLTVNLAVGAYLFMRTKKKDTGLEEETATSIPSTSVSSTPTPTTPVSEKPVSLPAISEPEKLREPIPEKQQRDLYKWILEEKRKVKPKDPEEKKRIDEEKAILKQFIRAKSIPSI